MNKKLAVLLSLLGLLAGSTLALRGASTHSNKPATVLIGSCSGQMGGGDPSARRNAILIGLPGIDVATPGACFLNIDNIVRPSLGVPMPSPGVIRNLFLVSADPGTGTNSGVAMVFVNGQLTALTCTLGTSRSCSDTSDEVSVSAGDLVSVEVEDFATGALRNLRVSIEKQ